MTETENKEVKVLESTVTKFEDISLENSKNYITQTLKLNFEDMVGVITFQGKKYDVRMPNTRLIKKFRKITMTLKELDLEVDNILEHMDEAKYAFEANDTQDQLIMDMIPDLDLDADDMRIDDMEYLELTTFIWEFYILFRKKLKQRGRDSISSIKGT